MSKGRKKSYYVVVRGRKPGLYYQWFGEGGAADYDEYVLYCPQCKAAYSVESARRELDSKQLSLSEL